MPAKPAKSAGPAKPGRPAKPAGPKASAGAHSLPDAAAAPGGAGKAIPCAPPKKPAKAAQTARPPKALRGRAQAIFFVLAARYPAPAPMLDFHDAWTLLVATVLAAQCTDARVNQVTPGLFARWPDPAALAQASQEDLEQVVHSTGFFRNKAKNLIGAARRIMDEYGGTVPATMAQLTSLPGVARKTANIVLSNAFGVHEGIAVDTHVKRLSYRLGLTDAEDPIKIEQDLMGLFDRDNWGEINHLLVYHGRDTCQARKPKCLECPLEDFCPKRETKGKSA